MIGKWPALLLVVAAFIFGASGCSPRKVDVTGRVTYNGAPLNVRGGKIVFVGPDDTQCAASINTDGTYQAIGVSAGLNRVAVSYPNPEFKPRKRGEPALAPESVPSPFLTPAKYASEATSELSVEVTAGTVFNAELKGSEEP